MIATIVNGLPIDINEEKPGFFDRFIVAKKPDNFPFSVGHVPDTFYLLWTGSDSGNISIPESGMVVAKSVCRDYAMSLYGADQEHLPMLFAMEGELSPEEIVEDYEIVLRAAMESHRNWLKRLVMLADDDWTKWHINQMISELQIHAAKELGLEREWTQVTEAGNLCPACFAACRPGQVVCRACKCILDPSKHSSLQFA